MTVDADLLRSLARREDPGLGITERFLRPTIGAGRSVAVLSEPLGERRDTGFVIAHSFGLEQTYLARLDVQLARTLSAAGFPVLRYHGQGYGDSDGAQGIDLSSHLEDATSAVGILAEEAGVDHVGSVGARFGGTVAALVADRLRLSLTVLIEPVVAGGRYVRDFLRSQLFADWTARVADDPSASSRDVAPSTKTMDDVKAELANQGWADIRGFRLSASARDQIAAMDLAQDLGAFDGSALVLAVSRSGQVRPDLQRLATHLRRLGARTTVRCVVDGHADTFGQYNLRMSGGSKQDTLSGVGRSLTGEVVAWCSAIGDVEATVG